MVSVEIDGKIVRDLTRGQVFGEKALLFNKLRSASIRVKERPLYMWAIDRVTFREICETFVRKNYLRQRKYIE